MTSRLSNRKAARPALQLTGLVNQRRRDFPAFVYWENKTSYRHVKFIFTEANNINKDYYRLLLLFLLWRTSDLNKAMYFLF